MRTNDFRIGVRHLFSAFLEGIYLLNYCDRHGLTHDFARKNWDQRMRYKNGFK